MAMGFAAIGLLLNLRGQGARLSAGPGRPGRGLCGDDYTRGSGGDLLGGVRAGGPWGSRTRREAAGSANSPGRGGGQISMGRVAWGLNVKKPRIR
jgi:hypothetical protein